MKKKQPEQSSLKPGASALKKVSIMSLLVRISFILCVIATLGLFTAIADLGIVDLTSVLSKYTWAFLTLQLLTSLLCAFAMSQISSANSDNLLQQTQALTEKFEGRIDLVDDKVQEYLGESYHKLKEQNETMKAEFDLIRENENNKIIAEIEELKIENADLRKKLDGNSSPIAELPEPENQLQVA